jgi:hypothetical protein
LVIDYLAAATLSNSAKEGVSMSHILLANLGSLGDLHPFIALGSSCVTGVTRCGSVPARRIKQESKRLDLLSILWHPT